MICSDNFDSQIGQILWSIITSDDNDPDLWDRGSRPAKFRIPQIVGPNSSDLCIVHLPSQCTPCSCVPSKLEKRLTTFKCSVFYGVCLGAMELSLDRRKDR